MTAEVWINAVTAIGTFAAVAVALWLGISANRRTDREAQTRARLAAAGISARLSTTADRLSSLAATSEFLDLTIPERDAIHNALAEVRRGIKQEYFRPDDVALLALATLPNNCAHRIARAFDYIDRVRVQDAALGAALLIDSTSHTQREHMLNSWRADLRSADDLLKVALRECIAASALGAPMPSGEELYGNEPE